MSRFNVSNGNCWQHDVVIAPHHQPSMDYFPVTACSFMLCSLYTIQKPHYLTQCFKCSAFGPDYMEYVFITQKRFSEMTYCRSITKSNLKKKKKNAGTSIEIPFCILHACNRVHNRSSQRNLIRDNEPQEANASSRNRCKAWPWSLRTFLCRIYGQRKPALL